jgi:transposase
LGQPRWMALSYVSTDRDQPFLLPPSVREWLPAGHLAWFVLDVVEEVDTSALHARHPNGGAGRAAYDPEMLLGVVLYAYCSGVRSSREIERLCEVDIAFRVLAANRVPDHTTVARFRQSCDGLVEGLFVDVLALCARAGLTKLGVVAVDGTKMGANASANANRTRAQLEAEVRAMFAEAEAVDAAEDERFGDARGDELPPELADPRTRGARLRAALAELDAQRAAAAADEAEARADRVKTAGEGRGRGRKPRWADEVAEAEAALARALEQQAAKRAEIEAGAAAKGRRPHGPKPTESNRVKRARARVERARRRGTTRDPAPEDPKATVNTTDPASRVMKTPDGWIQGYNTQAAVNEAGVVLAGDVTQDANDVGQLEPMMRRTQENLEAADVDEPIETMLFDAGYWSEDNITAEGPKRLIADTKRHKLAQGQATSGPPPPDATPLEAMRHQLRTPEGVALYAKRSGIVEPVFGQHKHNRGLRRFARRGLDAARAEWQLINTTHNILKLYRTRIAFS